jgi:hypothetical protein
VPPQLSVVVVAYNNPRELRRTLYSLCADHQRRLDPDDWEVVVVDNGSTIPIEPEWVAGFAGNFRLLRIDNASPSPAEAINCGLVEARGDVIGVMIDGSRIATPGLLHFALHGTRLHDTAIVATLGWYIGCDFQAHSPHPETERAREDALLASIAWPDDGYRLFEIGTMDESSVDGWFAPIAESNALFARREYWEAIGGVDERFDLPGGGLLNLDTFARLMELPQAELVVLLGEATFHQWHGGVSTNATVEGQARNFADWAAHFEQVRGRAFAVTQREKSPTYVGTLSQRALARFVRAAIYPAARGFTPPLGPGFNRDLWTSDIPERSSIPSIGHLVDLARAEFVAGRYEASCAVARLIRSRVPDEPGIRDLLSLVAPSVMAEGPHPAHRAEYHLALGAAYALLGETDRAAAAYRDALAVDRDLPAAHVGLSQLRMPGDGYHVVLERLYRALAPETAVEIGVFMGDSLALFRPPTIAIGVDPKASILTPLSTETHVYAETSDAFFAGRRYQALLGERPLSVGFIDGLHLFEQALKDFIGLEALCGPRSVIVFHDTTPLDEPTQSRERDTVFHSGDVWRVILCLKELRPDLDILTVATAPTGLTIVTGLDPGSRVLAERFDETVARYLDVPFSAIASDAENALNLVPNDWDYVRSHLESRGIL